MGDARFVAPKTVEVKLNDGGTRQLSGERVFLNLGTRPSMPPIPGLADAAMRNIELLELDRVPEHMVVLIVSRPARPAVLAEVRAASGRDVAARTLRGRRRSRDRPIASLCARSSDRMVVAVGVEELHVGREQVRRSPEVATSQMSILLSPLDGAAAVWVLARAGGAARVGFAAVVEDGPESSSTLAVPGLACTWAVSDVPRGRDTSLLSTSLLTNRAVELATGDLAVGTARV